jgi:hypothetical protein
MGRRAGRFSSLVLLTLAIGACTGLVQAGITTGGADAAIGGDDATGGGDDAATGGDAVAGGDDAATGEGDATIDGADACQNPVLSHPVLNHSFDSAAYYENRVVDLMAMSEEEMVELVPTKSGILWCGCPNCSHGQWDNAHLQFDWSIARPREIKCKFCNHVYPSASYPMDHVESGQNALGETVNYDYHLDSEGRDYWFEAVADYLRREWFVTQCRYLADAYHLTSNPAYARRAALILQRFAAAYPHMAVLEQWPGERRHVVSPNPPYPFEGGKWGRWVSDEVPHRLPQAYDLIDSSGEIEKLSQELGVDVREQIETGFFRATVEYVLSAPFGTDPSGSYHLTNQSPLYTEEMINIGRVVGDPGYVHWGRRWLEVYLAKRFFDDGMWRESPHYHKEVIDSLHVVTAALKRYSDPCGYVDPVDGTHLDNLDLEANHPFMVKAAAAPDLVAYPNGAICPVHDTFWDDSPLPARTDTISTLLPGFGHASLGRGQGANQLAAQLHFSGGLTHAHRDNLSFSLFAKGGETLSDIGYSHSKLNAWTDSTIGHNTVAIDRQDQVLSYTNSTAGDLQLFVPDLQGLSAVEATGEHGYQTSATVYRRLLVLVPVSDDDAYVVDVFRVKGGSTHDWLLHGSANSDMTAEPSIALATRTTQNGWMLEAGEVWTEPTGEGSSFIPYGVIRNVKQKQTSGPFTLTLRHASAAPAEVAGSGVRVHLQGGGSTEIFLGRSPRLRQSKGDDATVYDYWMPQLVARRTGTKPLQSQFVAVHEPFRTDPFLASVTPVDLNPSDPWATALEVRHGEFVDTVVATMDTAPYPERTLASGIRVRGKLAVVRERLGEVVAAWLVDGESVQKGAFTLTRPVARYEGTIDGVTRMADGAPRDAFTTAAALPPGSALSGRWLILTLGDGRTHGYRIDRVEADGEGSRIVLTDDPGLILEGTTTTEVYFPNSTIEGQSRFVIAEQAAFGL